MGAGIQVGFSFVTESAAQVPSADPMNLLAPSVARPAAACLLAALQAVLLATPVPAIAQAPARAPHPAPALALALAPPSAPAPPPAAAAPGHLPASSAASLTLRPAIEQALRQAERQLGARRPAEALALLAEAERQRDKSPDERLALAFARGSAQAAAGNLPAAVAAFEAVLDNPRAAAADRLALLPVVAEHYYRLQDYPRAVRALTRYFETGGTDPRMRLVLSQSLYNSKDFDDAVKALHAEVEQSEKLGRAPAEDRLKLLADSYARLNSDTGVIWTLERLIAYYPRQAYWVDVLARIRNRPGVGDRLLLDLFRLRLATGTLAQAADYVAMAQLALKSGLPAEARQVLERGFGAGVLGHGGDADLHRELRDEAARRIAPDRKALLKAEAQAVAARDKAALSTVGMSCVSHGDTAKGIALMQEGLRIGASMEQGDAKLHLGYALVQAGQRARAVDMFKTVRGMHGSADLARLWALHLRTTGP